ncbi:prephenate dehydrogenase [Heyndrickxia oleronia]|uniref:prephenate dehydrogenase n=1 Tax=Heyndrickxia oleronia TaxID=38875 RepID=UPI00203D466C|nr:prephenate dehydrogenase [Heyndrickxia oleronia]MCM3236545.1 prephenate dehydrogenase [Heyndrickxia oleronia]
MKGNVLIVGLGLIGGSLALTIKKQHPSAKIYGLDIHQLEIEKAIKLNVIHEKVDSLQQGAELADLIILSTPVLELRKIMKQLASMTLKENVIITDTGSTKGEIMEAANDVFNSKVTFIGGHPIAGSHKTGVENADLHLFDGAYYILTPSPEISNNRISELKNWLRGTNARLHILDKDEHDYIVGMISHLPHLMAGVLVNQAKKHATKEPLIRQMAAGGFRDITRIASSNPSIWSEIVMDNRRNLMELMEDWMNEIRNLTTVLQTGDEQAIQHFFEGAKEYRDSLSSHV